LAVLVRREGSNSHTLSLKTHAPIISFSPNPTLGTGGKGETSPISYITPKDEQERRKKRTVPKLTYPHHSDVFEGKGKKKGRVMAN